MSHKPDQLKRAPGLGKGHAECMLKYGLSLGMTLPYLLDGTDVPLDFLDDPFDISPLDELKIASNLIQKTENSFSTGFDLGLTYKVTDLGMFGLAIMSCRNGSHAAEMASRYLIEAYNFTNIRILSKNSKIQIILDLTTQVNDELGQFIVARDFGIIYRVSTYFLNRSENIAYEIGFNFQYSSGMDKVAKVFGCSVKNNQKNNYILIDINDFLVSPPFSNEMNALALEESYQSAIISDSTDEMTLSEKISAHLLENSLDINKKDISNLFHMSERTLSRHLEKEGLTWRGLINKVKLERAESLLEHTNKSIQDIGQEIGFSNLSSFSHAFTKYKGISPSEFRKLLDHMNSG